MIPMLKAAGFLPGFLVEGDGPGFLERVSHVLKQLFWSGWHLPPDYSTHGPAIDRLIYIVHIFMLLLFVAWGVFLAYCLVRYRKRAGHKASYYSNTSKLPKFAEIGVVLFEVFLLIGLSLPVWSAWKKDFPTDKDPLLVRIVAQQFQWNFQYAGEDGKFGRTDPSLISDANQLGIDPKDPNSWDDFVTANQFHIPINKPVIAHLTSKDVIHSFGVPYMRLKQDNIPGMSVPIWFVANNTGSFDIACSQLCGIQHGTMKGTMTVDSPQDYAKWVGERQRPFKPKEKNDNKEGVK